MHAEIVMIGTELLLGELVDTNANKLATALREIGLDLYYKTTVGDNEGRITEVLSLALDRSDVVITSGGIGPTVDDMTRQAVANATGRKLVYSKELEEQIAERFRSFGREMAENNKRQAYLPEGALPLTNPVGTAPCFLSEDVNGRGFVISLPGVPRELAHMLERTVIPLLIDRMGGRKVTKVRVLRTCGVGESNIDRVIGDLMSGSNPTIGLAAHPGQTDVRIVAKACTESKADELIAEMEGKLRDRLGVAIYGVGEETVPEVVGTLLAEKKLKLGVIDLLTGGQLVRELSEAGFGELVVAGSEAPETDGRPARPVTDPVAMLEGDDPRALATVVAERAVPAGGVGLALVGPFKDNTTFIAVCGPGVTLVEPSRNYQDSDHARRWFVMQALDRVRRALLRQLTSPADWK